MSPSVFVIVLTWNHIQDTVECLASLARQTYSNIRIVVADNGSTDDTLAVLRAQFPDAHIIENKKNLGYAQGNNVGIQYALAQNADYIFVLNNDTVLADDCVARLEAALQKNPNAAAAPRCYFYDAPTTIYFAGGRMSGWQTAHRGFNQPDRAEFDVACETEWLTGCALMAARDVWQRVGFFEPRFFLLFEDTDWSLRARRAGVALCYVADAKLWHKVSRSFGDTVTPGYAYYYMRNTLLFIERNFSWRQKRWMYRGALRKAHTQPILSAAADSPERAAKLHRAISQGIRDYFLRRFGKQTLRD